MNEKTLISALTGPLITGFIIAAQLENPDANDAAVASIAEGDAKHWLRGRINWGADIVWPIIEPQVQAAIAAQLKADFMDDKADPDASPAEKDALPVIEKAAETGIVDLTKSLTLSGSGSFTQEEPKL